MNKGKVRIQQTIRAQWFIASVIKAMKQLNKSSNELPQNKTVTTALLKKFVFAENYS